MPSVEIRPDVHIRIKESQLDLARDGKSLKISDIVNDAILKGLEDSK